MVLPVTLILPLLHVKTSVRAATSDSKTGIGMPAGEGSACNHSR